MGNDGCDNAITSTLELAESEIISNEIALVTQSSDQSLDVYDLSRLWRLDVIGITDSLSASAVDINAAIMSEFRRTAKLIDGHLFVSFPFNGNETRLATSPLKPRASRPPLNCGKRSGIVYTSI